MTTNMKMSVVMTGVGDRIASETLRRCHTQILSITCILGKMAANAIDVCHAETVSVRERENESEKQCERVK